MFFIFFFFFFQAEDGIRDFHVTGVQTCALPISSNRMRPVCKRPAAPSVRGCPRINWAAPLRADRKSTRLNSSHVKISYAVFCLKKKKKKKKTINKKKTTITHRRLNMLMSKFNKV